MAILVFFAAAAGAGIVAANLGAVVHDRGDGLAGTGVCAGGLCLLALCLGGLVEVLVGLDKMLQVGLGHVGGWGVVYVALGHDGDGAAHEHGDGSVVDLVDHVVEEVDGLELEDEERVFLLVGGVLHGLLQFVEGTEVFFPCVVDGVEEDCLLEGDEDISMLTTKTLLACFTFTKTLF